MRNNILYKEYLLYLDNRLNEGEIKRGKYSLLKISKQSFDEFIYKLENDEKFNDKIVKMVRVDQRDKNIDDIINSEKIDDIFDEFNI